MARIPLLLFCRSRFSPSFFYLELLLALGLIPWKVVVVVISHRLLTVFRQRQVDELGGLISEKSAAAAAAAAALLFPLQRCDRMLTPPDRH